MKMTEKEKNQEIGELINEIIQKSGYLEIERIERTPQPWNVLRVRVGAQLGQVGAIPEDDLSDFLRICVNLIRYDRGEPSTFEEIENAIQAEAELDGVPIISSCCLACGSTEPFTMERKVKLFVSQESGILVTEKPAGYYTEVHPGEIAACSACGKHYRFL